MLTWAQGSSVLKTDQQKQKNSPVAFFFSSSSSWLSVCFCSKDVWRGFLLIFIYQELIFAFGSRFTQAVRNSFRLNSANT